jgi:major membrane immunogen (membrane-anchored lipoprotein)
MHLLKTTAATALTLLLAACGSGEPNATDAPADTALAAPAADSAALQTEAVYGDEAPVAIEAEPADDHGHAHNADGSHPDGEDHAHDEAADDHGHDHGDGDHAH